MRYLLLFVISLGIIGCDSRIAKEEQPAPIRVELTTDKGKILLELSNKTPLHRDNLVKNLREGRLDSMIFHRVLEGFVAQAGEYDSLRSSKMDSMELHALDYTIPAEFDPTLFHKRGALGAARTDNPDRASGSQFYIVHRGPRPDSLIDVDEKRINGWLQKYYFINAAENKIWKDSLLKVERGDQEELYAMLQDTIAAMAKSFGFDDYSIPEEHRSVYRSRGGTPHLDQNYTVFGEVIQGMDVVDSIAVVKVNQSGRPHEPVYIISARVLD